MPLLCPCRRSRTWLELLAPYSLLQAVLILAVAGSTTSTASPNAAGVAAQSQPLVWLAPATLVVNNTGAPIASCALLAQNGYGSGLDPPCVATLAAAFHVLAANGTVVTHPPAVVWHLAGNTSITKPSAEEPALLMGAQNRLVKVNRSSWFTCSGGAGMCVVDCAFEGGPAFLAAGVGTSVVLLQGMLACACARVFTRRFGVRWLRFCCFVVVGRGRKPPFTSMPWSSHAVTAPRWSVAFMWVRWTP